MYLGFFFLIFDLDQANTAIFDVESMGGGNIKVSIDSSICSGAVYDFQDNDNLSHPRYC